MSFIYLFLITIIHIRAEHDSMPQHLIECYSQDFTLLPLTIRSLVDIIRKIETSEYYYMDMRMLTNAILNRFWRDGIERDPNIFSPPPGILPYRTSGFQSYKFKLLYSALIPNSGALFPNETLTLDERFRQINQLSGAKKSACPIEYGVVETSMGSISPSRILGAIATALQPMNIRQELLINEKKRDLFKYNKIINNMWAATLCGDLAEVLVFQKPLLNTTRIGPGGIWNNTDIPVLRYLISDFDTVNLGLWQASDAEILGAIDGLIIANELMKWTDISYLTKLSQALEMYYMDKGGTFPDQTRSCNRRDYFFSNLFTSETIIEQVINFAEVLAYNSPHYFINENYIENKVNDVYDAFQTYTSKLVQNVHSPCLVSQNNPKLNLYIVYDSTWDSFKTIQILTRLGKKADVSYYGSNITIINGATGEVIVDSATSVSEMFVNWNKANERVEIKSLDLHQGFVSLKNQIENKYNYTVPVSWYALVFMTSPQSDNSLKLSMSSIRAIKRSNPDVRFTYVTTTASTRCVEILMENSQDIIIVLERKNQDKLYKDIDFEIARDIRPFCYKGNFEFEDYVRAGSPQLYQIHPKHLCANKNIAIKVQNFDYGSLYVCATNTRECKVAIGFDVINFTSNPCQNDCKPILLNITAKRTLNKCSENGCRFLDDLRFKTIISGLNCIQPSSTCNAFTNRSNYFIILSFLIIHFFK